MGTAQTQTLGLSLSRDRSSADRAARPVAQPAGFRRAPPHPRPDVLLQDDVSGLRSDLQALKQRIRTQLGAGDELLGAMARKGDPPTRQLAAAAAAVAAAEQQQQQTGDGGVIAPQ